MSKRDLEYFFNPRSVAIIGPSRFPRKFGYVILENFLTSGFKGEVYPVNPKADEILMKKCYASVKDIPKSVDLAVIVLPAQKVSQAVKECVEKGVKACIIISGGFSEIGNKKGEEEILSIAKEKMRIIGPNVFGIYDAYTNVDTIFAPRYRLERPKKGHMAFISQSGAFGTALLDTLASYGIGISKFISIGNRIDVDEVDLLEYLAKDKETRAIALYIEGVKRGKEFVKTLKSVTKRKPVVIYKAGKTKKAKEAVKSHTATIAGDERIYSAVFKQCGAIEANTVEELMDFTKAFSYGLHPKGDRVQIITNGGGFGVITADEVEKRGLKLAELSSRTIEEIKKRMPPYAVISNPMDLIGDANAERYKIALDFALKDKNVDLVITIILIQLSLIESDIIDVLAEMKKKYEKPIIVCATGGEFTMMHRKMLEKNGIPTYDTPERAVAVAKALVDYASMH